MSRIEENEKMIKSMEECNKIDSEVGMFWCLIDISRSLAVIADNTNHLNPFYGLCKEASSDTKL